VRQNLAIVAGFLEARGNRFSGCAVLLWSDANTVPLAVARHDLAQERGVSLLAKFRRKALGILLVTEAAKLHSPHAGR
jgi:hypothetical protein